MKEVSNNLMSKTKKGSIPLLPNDSNRQQVSWLLTGA